MLIIIIVRIMQTGQFGETNRFTSNAADLVYKWFLGIFLSSFIY